MSCSSATAAAGISPEPMRGTLIICADYESLSREAARRFVAAAESSKRAFYVALAGGGTPRRLYELLATSEFERRIPWERVHLFWGDERLVPHDHPQSNYKLARESLLRHVRLPPKHVHSVPVNLPLEQAAAAYEQELRSTLGRWGFPRFDLVLLGLGDDGHTASLFPRAASLQEKQKLVATHRMPGTEPARVTLTLPVINAAKRVLFLVSGENKATALRTVVEGTGQLPAHLVAPRNGELLWLADTAAAGKLKRVKVQHAAEVAHG